MLKITITPEMMSRAILKSKEMGELNNSITKGDGNLAGFLGEEVANSVIQGVITNTYDYDIVKDYTTYDVKTKRCTSAPKTDYDCSVAEFNITQRCDRYVFVRIENINGKWGDAWLLGWIDKKEYFKQAKHLKKGDYDPSNNFYVKASCYNLKIYQLESFKPCTSTKEVS
jgi:hypothetical protein